MADTKRLRVIKSIIDMIKGNTSAERRVYYGRVHFSGDDDAFPLISIIPGDGDLTEKSTSKQHSVIPLNFLFAVDAEIDDPGFQIEALFGELKTILFQAGIDATQKFGTDSAKLSQDGEGGIAHDDGDPYITATIRATLDFHEQIGDPYK